ncbi:Hint domain-containing protein [Nioella sp.]|uniref:Hint domain-containing protein n=1 Tax=Nioella sp. TaxID=1912091 RepID=UPI003B528182
MATATYSTFYYLGPVGVPTTLTFPSGNAYGIGDVIEIDPTPSGGSTDVGEAINVFGASFTLAGVTDTGDPVVDLGGGELYVFSNNAALGGTTVTLSASTYTFCFLPGTGIATPAGEVAVEDLSIGDRILSGADGEVRVKWIGRQTVSTRFGPAERLMPVRFAAGSLGDGLPHTDLTVTADHGMLVDGVICHAGALVNGTTITRVPLAEMGDSYTVYHIETEEHEIILANGAPAETFIDNVSRRVFDNYAEFEALYGDVPEMEELPYPRAMSARQVPAHIANRLAKRQVA